MDAKTGTVTLTPDDVAAWKSWVANPRPKVERKPELPERGQKRTQRTRTNGRGR